MAKDRIEERFPDKIVMAFKLYMDHATDILDHNRINRSLKRGIRVWRDLRKAWIYDHLRRGRRCDTEDEELGEFAAIRDQIQS